jgi:hypothetical protein
MAAADPWLIDCMATGTGAYSSSMIKFRMLQARAVKWEENANRNLIWERNANIHCEESNETGSVTLKWILWRKMMMI